MEQVRKVALLIGIDVHDDQSIPQLSFCKRDAEELAELLQQPEYNFEVELLSDEAASQRAIRLASHRIRSTNPDCFLLFSPDPAKRSEIVATS